MTLSARDREQGMFGNVFQVRKKSSGQVFAAKLWNEDKPQPNLTHLTVLSELSALLKVNDGWHACDELDRAWCPIVQLHGLFLRPRGLLMEEVRPHASGRRPARLTSWRNRAVRRIAICSAAEPRQTIQVLYGRRNGVPVARKRCTKRRLRLPLPA